MKRRSMQTIREDLKLPMGIKVNKIPYKRNIANLANTRYPIIAQVCKDLNFDLSYERETMDWDIMWTDSAVSIDFLTRMQKDQKINHFPGMANLSRKGLLTKNLKRMQKAFPDSYAYFPLTFILPQDIMSLNKFQDRMRLKGERATFIIKPEVGCQGRGIYLWQDSIELQAKTEIVQLYIQRPLLYKGLKFDLRVYVLITGCSPLRLYIFNEGLVRFATQTYQRPNSNNIDDLRMHLTNYAINKESPKYIFNDSLDDLAKGHKKSLAQFFSMLNELGLPAHEYWASIRDISVKTVIAGLPWLRKEYDVAQPNNLQNSMCFQVLGLDFMIEETHRVHLLEINHTPSFFTDTPLDYYVKNNLVRDTIELVQHEHRMRKKKMQKSSPYKRTLEDTNLTASDVTFSNIKQTVLDEEETLQLDDRYLGSYERIYPCYDEERQQKYSRLIAYSLSSISFELSPNRKKSVNHSNFKKRINSQPKYMTALVSEYVQPAKQKIRMSRLLRPDQTKVGQIRGVANAFDRQIFRQQIAKRNNLLKVRKGKDEDYQDEQGIRGYTKESAPELTDILEYHQLRQTSPQQSRARMGRLRQPFS